MGELDKKLAERSGFEPEIPLYRVYSLSRRAPSANSAISPLIYWGFILAEGVGFEPTVPRKRDNGFQDRLLKPLGHPSNRSKHIIHR